MVAMDGKLFKEDGSLRQGYIPLPLEYSDKQDPKLDFFPQIVSVLVFPSTSLMKAENTL